MKIDANAVIQKLKKQIGDLSFQLAVLEAENEMLKTKLAEVENEGGGD